MSHFPGFDPTRTSRLVDGVAPNGKPIVSLLFGVTFGVGKEGACIGRRSELAEEYLTAKASVPTRWTKPSLLVRDVDLYAWRNLTDLVVQGVARVDKPTKSFEVTLQATGSIKPLKQTLVCTGDRFVDKGSGGLVASEPEELDEIHLSYENAYGGTDEEAEEVLLDRELVDFMTKSLGPEENEELSFFSYPRNPAGKGYLVHEAGAVGTPLPNLEFADDRLSMAQLIRPMEEWGVRPMPAAFDWQHPAWFPRCAFLGDFPPTSDDRVPELERKLGLFDERFDKLAIIDRPKHGFANGAHPYLARRRFEGDERISLTRTSRDGRDFLVKLPGLKPSVSLALPGEAKVKVPASVDLVFVETELEQVTVVWRATHFREREHLPLGWEERCEPKIHW